MPATILIGTQWGDEGKGKVTDVLMGEHDFDMRFQGGANAGHTVGFHDDKEEQRVVLHYSPVGVLHEGKKAVSGPGTVNDLEKLGDELENLRNRDLLRGEYFLSDRAGLILPYHYCVEKQREGRQGIGTTGRAIGPTYGDRTNRCGPMVGHLFDRQMFIDLCKRALEDHRMKGKFKPEKIYDEQMRQLERILTYGMVEDTSVLVNKWLDEGKCGLLEGAQGTHLDILHGTYPFVTSSNTVAGNACTGACVGPTRISRVVGVVKAYVTRVGAGPFPTEMPEDVAKRIRNRNDERGATTGRDRRIGYPDVPLVLSSVELNSVTELAITRLDGLDGEGSIPVCTHYGCKNPERFPGPGEIRDAAPKYEELKLWTGSVNGVTNYDKLGDAQHYIEFWEQKTGRPVTIISTGPNREHTIRRDSKDSNVKDAYRAAHSG